MSKLARGEERFAYLIIFPTLLLLLGLLLYPVGYAVYISFTDTDGLSFDFVGLRNYADLFSDPTTWRVLLNNFVFLLSVPLVVLSALFCAVLIYEKTWGWKFFRIVYFIPNVISSVVIGILFRTIFSFDGPINGILGVFGISPIDWLGSGQTASVVIILVLVWSGFGYGILILLAGMSNINPSIFEASRIDGANYWQRVRFITVPLIARVMVFLAIINVIYIFLSLFGLIYALTSGGPGYETTTIDYFIYLKAFTGADMGGGAALALFLFVITLALTALQLRFVQFDGEL